MAYASQSMYYELANNQAKKYIVGYKPNTQNDPKKDMNCMMLEVIIHLPTKLSIK